MNEVLTRAEMEAQFDSEWVLVADPEIDNSHEVRRGRVVYHGSDREAMYDMKRRLDCGGRLIFISARCRNASGSTIG